MPEKRTWFSVAKNASNKKTADVSIHAEIGYWGITARSFMEQLRLLGDLDTINLSIHSPGGEVIDGWAIYNALKIHPAKVIVTVKGFAASMASVIMLAGDEIRIPKKAYVMIHRVVGGAFGDADEIKQYAELVAKLEDGIVAAYTERSGLDEKTIRKMMETETYMDGEEAVAKGFADKVISSPSTKACASWRNHFSAPPRSLFDTSKIIEPATDTTDTINDMTDQEIQDRIATGIKTALDAHNKDKGDPLADLKKTLGSDIAAAMKDPLAEALKPLGDRLDKVEAFGTKLDDLTGRLEKAENLVKHGVAGAAGGTRPANNGGESNEEDEGGKDALPKDEAELRKALAKLGTHKEKSDLVAKFKKSQVKA